MLRTGLIALVLLFFTGAYPIGEAVGRFDTKLTPEQQVIQAVNRLTFGPRPGDVEAVRRMGVEKWIDLQLHPDRIPENSVLDEKLEPFETIRLDVAEILTRYFPQRPPGAIRITPLTELLSQEEMRKTLNGTAEERRAAFERMTPQKREQVLAMVQANVLEGLPDLQQEAKAARERQQEERNKEMRKMRPPLNEILTPQQVQIANRGTREQRMELITGLEPVKRQQVALSLPPNALSDFPDLRRTAAMSRNPRQVPTDDLRSAKLFRAIYSNRQLQEVLTDFWFNHFNVFEGKGQQEQSTLAAYERDAIRPHVFGKFKDLLLATARHPAMLHYLDNWESMAANFTDIGPFAPGPFGNLSPFARQAHGLNENYGREIMELHTLGVNGGYTQDDVVNVARCLTGWTIKTPNSKPEFIYASFMHDAGEKAVLGHHIAAGGQEQDGLEVIDILAHHPSTAHFISRLLAQRFVADDPPPVLVDRMAKVFLKNDGDLRVVMETMFKSPEFFSDGAWQAKLKSPLESVVSAVRATGAEVRDTFFLAQQVAEMGEPLYDKQEPTGYKDSAETWLSTAGVMARISFGSSLASDHVSGVNLDISRFAGQDPAAIAHELLNRDPSPETMGAITRGLEGKQPKPETVVGLVISSPEFQRR